MIKGVTFRRRAGANPPSRTDFLYIYRSTVCQDNVRASFSSSHFDISRTQNVSIVGASREARLRRTIERALCC